MAQVLLAVAQLSGLLLIALGAPGVWLQIIALMGFGWWTGFTMVDHVPIFVLLTLAGATELLRMLLVRSPVEAGARRSMSTGGVLGAALGAAVGLAFPLVGSMVGALAGAIAGALAAGIRFRSVASRRDAEIAGPAVAAALRATTGIAIASFTLFMLTQ